MEKSPPPEELDTQVPEQQCCVRIQFFTSLLRFGSGWFANHSLQRTTPTTLGLQSDASGGAPLNSFR
jgi:hypothetical protein